MQGVDNIKKTRDLTEEELTLLRNEVDKYTHEGELRKEINLNIKRLMDIGCHRGRRHQAVRQMLLKYVAMYLLRLALQCLQLLCSASL